MLGALIAMLAPLGGQIDARVEATTPRWSGDSIVTELAVRLPNGDRATVLQLGGSLDGIGMTFSHVAKPAHVGDAVELRDGHVVAVLRRVDRGDARPRLAVDVAGTTTGHVLLAPGDAQFGLERTRNSGRPLIRRRAFSFAYDGAGTRAVDGALELAEVDEAFAEWVRAAAPCTELLFDRSVEAVPNARDERDSIRFLDDRWCRPRVGSEPEICYPRDATAVTRVVFVDDPANPDDGTILEADIDINGVDFPLSITPRAGTYDIRSIITHEIGHALGLDHTCHDGIGTVPADLDGNAVPACPDASVAARAATMFVRLEPGTTSMRTLERSDIDGVCALFSAREPSETTGGCASHSGGGGGAISLLVLAFCLRRRRTSWTSLNA